MKKIVLENKFHGTKAEVELNINGHVNAISIDNAARILCGMKDCSCVPIQMNGICIVDSNGDLYEID